MVRKLTCIPINTNKELERLQSDGCEIINVYLVKEQGQTRGDIHIIYRELRLDSFCHSEEFGYKDHKCDVQCDNCKPRPKQPNNFFE